MSKDFSALPYRAGVGVMLLNKAGRVFVAKRIDTVAEAWQMPQGGMDAGETPEAAARRELQEETGVTRAEILGRTRDWKYYDLPAALIPEIWGGKYRGQKQHWFCMRFMGGDSEINIHGPHPEFSEWRWVEPRSLPDLIVPFKRDLYAELVAEFASYF